MPLIWLSIMGIGLSSSFTVPNSNLSYLKFMTPGIIGMSILFTSIFSAISVIWDKQFGFLKEMLVAPISRTSIVLGKVIGSTTISLITGILTLIIASFVGGISLTSLSLFSIIEMILLMVLISFSFVSIGLLIASRLNNIEGFQVIMSALVMPLFFLSGAFFPLENAPSWMQILSHLDPLMYGVDGLRGLLIGVNQLDLLLDIGVLTSFSIALLFAAALSFRKMSA